MRSYAKPQPGEYHEYYHQYISLIDEDRFVERFRDQPGELNSLLAGLTPDQSGRLHEPYTWSLKQVVGHLIDGERIFSNRMLRIAVGDREPIPGIEQRMYVAAVDYPNVTMPDLLQEFQLLRGSNVLLAARFSESALARIGIASNHTVSARASLYLMVGHVEYHLRIIRLRAATSPG